MGIPIYPPKLDDDSLRPYYDGLARGELWLTTDAQTGEFVWYPPEVIPGKPGAKLAWKQVGPNGKVYAFTTVVRSLLPGDHKDEVPFTVVLFVPDDAPGVRVPGLLVGDVPPACEMRVHLSPVQAGDWTVAGFAPDAQYAVSQ